MKKKKKKINKQNRIASTRILLNVLAHEESKRIYESIKDRLVKPVVKPPIDIVYPDMPLTFDLFKAMCIELDKKIMLQHKIDFEQVLRDNPRLNNQINAMIEMDVKNVK